MMSSAGAQGEAYYEQRGMRASALHDAGKKVIGNFCCFVPEEIITALDMVPYHIQGRPMESIHQADTSFDAVTCPFARSCFSDARKRKYDFLDGFVFSRSCGRSERPDPAWQHDKPLAFHHLLNVPPMPGPTSDALYREELAGFIKSLEAWSGRRMDPDRLKEEIRHSNHRRALLRELYELRKSDPPLVSGTEIIKVLVAGMGIPAAEHINLLERLIVEVQERPGPKALKLPRVFIWGNESDDIAFIKLLEENGAHVVMDDLFTGPRFFREDVPETDDPLEGIASRYLSTRCPRNNVLQAETREKDLENRFGYIRRLVKEWKADGAIFHILRYCHTGELGGTDLRDYLNGMKLPVLMIEDDCATSATGQLRTRIQAFLEMIE